MRFLLPICKFLSFRKKQTEMGSDFRQHIEVNDLARESKSNDKKKTEEDNTFVAACFDLEEVLMTPKCQDSSMYYRRELCTYNLTVYDLGTKDGFCYVWHEGMASRGSCEIATCVFMYLKHLALRRVKDVVLYSDSCGGQNQNRYFLNILWYSLKMLNFRSITHKFLVKGQTQNV